MAIITLDAPLKFGNKYPDKTPREIISGGDKKYIIWLSDNTTRRISNCVWNYLRYYIIAESTGIKIDKLVKDQLNKLKSQLSDVTRVKLTKTINVEKAEELENEINLLKKLL